MSFHFITYLQRIYIYNVSSLQRWVGLDKVALGFEFVSLQGGIHIKDDSDFARVSHF
jgi:hypothetical protein